MFISIHTFDTPCCAYSPTAFEEQVNIRFHGKGFSISVESIECTRNVCQHIFRPHWLRPLQVEADAASEARASKHRLRLLIHKIIGVDTLVKPTNGIM